jgi:drug/metabolite transporter (DMT)-like permease
MVEVMLAPVWVWLLLDETASAGTFIGGAILLVAVAVNAVAGATRRPSEGVAPPPRPVNE